jgi:hypothetical protein
MYAYTVRARRTRRRRRLVDKRSVRNVRWDEIDDRNSQTTNKFWQNGRYKLVMSGVFYKVAVGTVGMIVGVVGGRGGWAHCAFIQYGWRIREQYISPDTISYFIPRTALEEKKRGSRSVTGRKSNARELLFVLFSQRYTPLATTLHSTTFASPLLERF